MNRTDLLKIAKPILFNTEMVKAILDGRKTVTRRAVKPQPTAPRWNCIGYLGYDDGHGYQMEQQYKVGDILYVRETFYFETAYREPGEGTWIYKASNPDYPTIPGVWRPSIHMPKEAARIFLKVTDVRVERLQDITPEQVDKEGCKEYGYNANTGELLPSTSLVFSIRWNSTIKKQDLDKYGWNANPWVWVYEFERIENNENNND